MKEKFLGYCDLTKLIDKSYSFKTYKVFIYNMINLVSRSQRKINTEKILYQ